MPRLPSHLRGPLTQRFQSSLTAVVDHTAPKIEQLWDDLDGYDEDSVETLALAAASPMQALKTHVVRQALGYYTILSGIRPPSVPVGDVRTTPSLRDPFISVWQALASGNSFPDALAAGRARIDAVVSNFANSSARQTGDLFVAKADLKPHGWERIPDAGACAWCEDVAGEIYSSADSADFGHDRCGCSAAPVFD